MSLRDVVVVVQNQNRNKSGWKGKPKIWIKRNKAKEIKLTDHESPTNLFLSSYHPE